MSGHAGAGNIAPKPNFHHGHIGTPRSGTPRNSTPRNSTPRNSTPRTPSVLRTNRGAPAFVPNRGAGTADGVDAEDAWHHASLLGGFRCQNLFGGLALLLLLLAIITHVDMKKGRLPHDGTLLVALFSKAALGVITTGGAVCLWRIEVNEGRRCCARSCYALLALANGADALLVLALLGRHLFPEARPFADAPWLLVGAAAPRGTSPRTAPNGAPNGWACEPAAAAQALYIMLALALTLDFGGSLLAALWGACHPATEEDGEAAAVARRARKREKLERAVAKLADAEAEADEAAAASDARAMDEHAQQQQQHQGGAASATVAGFRDGVVQPPLGGQLPPLSRVPDPRFTPGAGFPSDARFTPGAGFSPDPRFCAPSAPPLPPIGIGSLEANLSTENDGGLGILSSPMALPVVEQSPPESHRMGAARHDGLELDAAAAAALSEADFERYWAAWGATVHGDGRLTHSLTLAQLSARVTAAGYRVMAGSAVPGKGPIVYAYAVQPESCGGAACAASLAIDEGAATVLATFKVMLQSGVEADPVGGEIAPRFVNQLALLAPMAVGHEHSDVPMASPVKGGRHSLDL